MDLRSYTLTLYLGYGSIQLTKDEEVGVGGRQFHRNQTRSADVDQLGKSIYDPVAQWIERQFAEL